MNHQFWSQKNPSVSLEFPGRTGHQPLLQPPEERRLIGNAPAASFLLAAADEERDPQAGFVVFDAPALDPLNGFLHGALAVLRRDPET